MRAQGQSLVELAVFGSLIVLLFGVMINYGLNYDFQQHAAMRSFRQALGIAATPLASDPTKPTGSASTVLVTDRHIPNPSSPLATGSINPVMASGSVTRNFLMQETPDSDDALPTLTLQVDNLTGGCPGSELSPAGSPPPCKYLTADFRIETGVRKQSLPRYRQIYGSVCAKTRCGGSGCTIKKNGQEECKNPLTLNIVDSCEGEIISYDACVRQARLINDRNFCTSECTESRSPEMFRKDVVCARRTDGECENHKNCVEICRERTAHQPWYAVGCTAAGSCPPLDNFFVDIKDLGLQPGYVKESQASHTLTTRQGSFSTSGDWQERTTRRLMVVRPARRALRRVPPPRVPQPVVSEKHVPTDASY